MIGLLPAAGSASRLGRLPGSKEVLPVGWGAPGAPGAGAPRVAASFVLEAMRAAGILRAFWILREGKWDIPAYFGARFAGAGCAGAGAAASVQLAYLVGGPTPGAAFTLDVAYPFVKDADVALGFPDILFEPSDALGAFPRVLERRAASGADIVLGLFPARDPAATDMVDAGPDGEVRAIEVKPPRTRLADTWGVAAWGPRFTRFLHELCPTLIDGAGGLRGGAREVHVGDAIRAALASGLRVEAVRAGSKPYLDIGTPEGFREALRRLGAGGDAGVLGPAGPSAGPSAGPPGEKETRTPP